MKTILRKISISRNVILSLIILCASIFVPIWFLYRRNIQYYFSIGIKEYLIFFIAISICISAFVINSKKIRFITIRSIKYDKHSKETNKFHISSIIILILTLLVIASSENKFFILPFFLYLALLLTFFVLTTKGIKVYILKWILLTNSILASLIVAYGVDLREIWVMVIGLIYLLATTYLWSYKKYDLRIIVLIFVSIFLISLGIGRWVYVLIGDEYVFYRTARDILLVPQDIFIHFFNGTYIYDTHPFLSSLLQIPLFFIFGTNYFAWKMSSLIMVTLSSVLIYSMASRYINKNYALVLSVAFTSSSYLISFGKIGYNNTQALFALLLTLSVTEYMLRKRSYFSLYLLGGVLALNFYVFPAALYVPPLVVLATLLSKKKVVIQEYVAIAIGAITLLTPLIYQPKYWDSKLLGTFLHPGGLENPTTGLSSHFLNNFVYAFFSPFHFPFDSHFVSNYLLDFSLQLFFVAGFSYVIIKSVRSRVYLWFLLSYIFLVIVVGTTHNIPNPPITRMFLLVPFTTTISILGLLYISENLFTKVSVKYTFIVAILLLIVATSLVQVHVLNPYASGKYQAYQAFFIKAVQEASGIDAEVFIIHEDKDLYKHTFGELLHIYNLEEVAVSSDIFTSDEIGLLANRLVDMDRFIVLDLRNYDESISTNDFVVFNKEYNYCYFSDLAGEKKNRLITSSNISCEKLIN